MLVKITQTCNVNRVKYTKGEQVNVKKDIGDKIIKFKYGEDASTKKPPKAKEGEGAKPDDPSGTSQNDSNGTENQTGSQAADDSGKAGAK